MSQYSFAITTTRDQLSALAPDEDAHLELLLGFAQIGPHAYRVLGHVLHFDEANCLSGRSPAMRTLPEFARKAIGSSVARSVLNPATLCEFLYMTLSSAASRARQLRDLEDALAAASMSGKSVLAVEVADAESASFVTLRHCNGHAEEGPCTLSYTLTGRLPTTVRCQDADLRARLLSRPLPGALLPLK